MTALAAPKLTIRNRLECFTLYALFQGVPLYSIVVLMMKLIATSEIVGERYGASIFIVLAATFHGLAMICLAPKFPRFFRHNHTPVFDDATLSFSEKITRWLAEPKTAVELLTNVMLMSVLAIGVTSIR
ncbi:hypothetical protein [Bradyrhizobium sp. BR 10289]|uniref:hypothetical protein n=1 Tax=Bradyrhizobium sp. BR 10289 TaxID=2749993 RepID=UPI001C6492BD|nr:hypothetical protein [Bradyrhizobium sp. BR 10289]MBW7971142.1 hypothetical protein [Bradyrhizobium sp. BR 10289]